MLDPGKLTVRTWYVDHFARLFHTAARPRTVEAYLDTLSMWDQYAPTPHAAVTEITNLHLAEWRTTLHALGLQPATINKHLRHLAHVLAKLGPPGPRNRDALALIAIAPWAAPLPTDEREPEPPTIETVLRTYRAATPYWAAYIVAGLHIASRRAALLALKPSQIDWASRTARMDAAADKKRRTRKKVLSRCVLRHLVRLRTGDDRPLLDWTESKSKFYTAWHRQLDRAALTADQRYTPHDLKRLAGTLLADIGASEWAIRHHLDHAQRDVTGASYVAVVHQLRQHVEQLPALDLLAQSTEPDPGSQIELDCMHWF